jgi:hypothetical protein
MSTKRKLEYSSTSSRPIVYVVLQRTSTYLPGRDEHDVSCVSVHTSMVAANRAAERFFDIDEADEEGVERENGWSDWEDLNGTLVQTNSEGLLRVIVQTDTQGESLLWVEKKFVTAGEEEESGDVTETESGEDDFEDDTQENPTKRLKVCTHPSFRYSRLARSNVNICRSAIQVKLST